MTTSGRSHTPGPVRQDSVSTWVNGRLQPVRRVFRARKFTMSAVWVTVPGPDGEYPTLADEFVGDQHDPPAGD